MRARARDGETRSGCPRRYRARSRTGRHDVIDYWLLFAIAYSDDVRFDGVPWSLRPGHAPSSSAVPNGDATRRQELQAATPSPPSLDLRHTQTTRARSARTIGAAEGRPRIPRREKARGLRDRDELPLGRFRDAEMVRPVRHSGTNPLRTHRLWRDPCRTRLVIAGVRAASSRAQSACRRQKGPAPLAPAESEIPCH